MASTNMEKRAQVTIFIIVAVVIVAVFLAWVIYPRIKVIAGEVNPEAYMSACMLDELEDLLPVLQKQGGYSNPGLYMKYNGERVQYLCYTDEYYKPCVVQQPILVGHVQGEIKNRVEPAATACMQQLKQIYEKKGYEVSASGRELNVSVAPGMISLDFASNLIVTKDGTQRFNSFKAGKNTKLYELLMTATSIVQFESTLGDSETLLYVKYYPDLIINKMKRDEGTVYRLKNVVSQDEFSFATKSLVWPQGYGVSS